MTRSRLLLFIHGFCNNSNAWNKMRELLLKDSTFNDIKFDTFNYSSGLLKKKSKKKNHVKVSFFGFQELFYDECSTISELADQLSKRINLLYREYDEVVLVCHSMG